MSKIKNIIISRTDKLGDLILSIPSFFMIKLMYPDAKLTILINSYTYDILKNMPYIDNIIKINEYSEKELIQIIRNLKPDVFLSLFTNKYVGKLALKSGAQIRIGPYSKLHSFFYYNKGVWQKRSKSIKREFEYNLDIVRKLDENKFDLIDLKKEKKKVKIFVDNENKDFINDFLKKNKIDKNKKIIIVHPFSGNSATNLKLEQYLDLIKKINRTLKVNLILSCHISDKKKASIFEKEAIFFANEGSILNLAELINRSDLFIAASTGPTHIAGIAEKCKVMAFYPNTQTQSPKRWGTFNSHSKDIEYIIPQEHCPEKYGCRKSCKYYNCFDSVNLDEVIDKIKKILYKA